MNLKTKIKAALVTLALLPSLVFASGDYSSRKLLTDIFHQDPFARGYAMGYILATAHASDTDLFCIPQGVSNGDLRNLVFTHLNSGRVNLNMPAILEVTHAFILTFPCSKRGQL
jgi:hypothetical protein